MRVVAAALALATILAGVARAQPAHFDIIPSVSVAAAGQPFDIDVHLIGTLDANALEYAANIGFGFVVFTLSVDGAMQSQFGLAFDQIDPGQYVGTWRFPTAWQATGVTLSAGMHTILASYGGDTVNPAMSTSLSMAVLLPVTLGGGPGKGGELTPYLGVLPGVLPIGLLTLKDITTGAVTTEDISEFLVVDPLDQSLHLNLGSLKDDTLVSFPGDANFAPLSFTYDAQDVPEPAGLLAVGALGAIWAARRRAIRLA